jgi:methylphosphotriester-DNA--protein-cysteine methyltransferase
MGRTYLLLGRAGRTYPSRTPGKFGGTRNGKLYGRLDCPSALRALERGSEHYVKHRVFFATEADAIAAGYRPCARCLPEA